MTTDDKFPAITKWSGAIYSHQRSVRDEVNKVSSEDQPTPIGQNQDLETDESRLIHAAQQGDLEAFNRLVIAYQDTVYTLAYYLLGDSMAAEDVVEEAFLSAYRSLQSYRGGSFRSWLYQIVTNNYLDELRDRKRHLETGFEVSDVWGSKIESPSWSAYPGETPEERLLRAEIDDRILVCIDRLTAEHRMAIVLVDILDMRYREAAKIMCCPLGTIKSLLARARLHMQHFLGDHLNVTYR